MKEEIVNRVAKSSLITINLEDYYPAEPRTLLDVKDWLFERLILISFSKSLCCKGGTRPFLMLDIFTPECIDNILCPN